MGSTLPTKCGRREYRLPGTQPCILASMSNPSRKMRNVRLRWPRFQRPLCATTCSGRAAAGARVLCLRCPGGGSVPASTRCLDLHRA
ncbi:hypothetical protein FRIGORI9N_470195 [Frigoribacterium sp. 9N]|nr:hypothetical protein FRIGORI9N_470195 [Frigoribacterium sp. 9N]